MTEYHVTTEMASIAARESWNLPGKILSMNGASNMSVKEIRELRLYVQKLCEQCQVKIVEGRDRRDAELEKYRGQHGKTRQKS